MIKFEHDGFQISCQRACRKRYDGANILRWNFEVEPFVVRWIIQMEENTSKLGVVGDQCHFEILLEREGVIVDSC